MTLLDPRLFLTDSRHLPPYVDAAPVRHHLAVLAETGVGYKRVAELAGLSPEVVRVIVDGRRGARAGQLPQRVTRDAAERILAVDAIPATGYLVPATGARRRIQALTVMGWTQAHLAERLGLNISRFGRLLRQEYVRATTHAAVAVLYDELWNVQPPLETQRDQIAAARARSYSRALGWASPLAWDDIDTDDEPSTEGEEVGVDEIAVELAVSGQVVPLGPRERRAVIAQCNALGMSDRQIGLHAGIPDRSVLRIRQELGIPAADAGTR
jgi:hypothetical protein